MGSRNYLVFSPFWEAFGGIWGPGLVLTNRVFGTIFPLGPLGGAWGALGEPRRPPGPIFSVFLLILGQFLNMFGLCWTSLGSIFRRVGDHCRSIDRSLNQSINESINPSINPSIDRSIPPSITPPMLQSLLVTGIPGAYLSCST